MIGSEFAILVSTVNAMVVVLNCTATGDASTVIVSRLLANLQHGIHGDIASCLDEDIFLNACLKPGNSTVTV